MGYPDITSIGKRVRYRPLLQHIFKTSTFLLHAGFFTGATLIGIARYALGVPAGLTELMAIWSIVLLLAHPR
jgi:hypothetical protein